MSGVKRNILADIARDGKQSEEELQEALSPEAMRAEKGTAGEDKEESGK